MSLSQLFAGGSGHEDDEAAGQIHASSSAQTDSLDALLDEIDTVLTMLMLPHVYCSRHSP